MSLFKGTKLSSTFHAVAAGSTAIVASVAAHKSGQVEPFVAGVMGMAGYLAVCDAGDKIIEAAAKVKRHFYQDNPPQ